MFDLFRSRAKSMRYLLIVLLSLVALSMIVTLVPGFGSGGSSRREDVVAEVGDEVITSRYIQNLVQQQIRARQLTTQVAEMAVPTIVNQVVGELSTAYQARRLGFDVSNKELIENIETMMPQLFQDGNFVGKDIYQSYLAQMNMSIPDFERKVRQQILLDKLQRVAFDGIVVTQKEVEAEYQKRTEKARLEVVKFDIEEMKPLINPTKEELLAFLKIQQPRFARPPVRTLGIVIADADKLGEALAVSEATLRTLYDNNRDRYKVDERVKVRHILIKADQGASKEEKAKARMKAADLLKQIRGGANFADLAKKNSDDPGSAAKGGDYDWIGRGQTVKPFEDTAFAQKAGEISEPVETQFGYHIIQTIAKEPSRVKPFEEVKADMLTEYRKRQLFEKMPALIEAARADIIKAPDQAEAIAKKLGLLYVRVEKAGPGFEYPILGRLPDLDNNVAPLLKNGVTNVIQTKDNKLVVAVAHEVTPARPAELHEVEADVRRGLAEIKGRELVEKKAREFEARLKANNNDLHKTAKELNKKIIDTGLFERTGTMKDVGPAAYFGEQPFMNPVGQVIGIYRISTTNYFFRIAERVPGEASGLEAQRSAIVSGIKERKLRERRELFEEGLVRVLKDEGKVKVYDDVVKRLASSYRGA